MFPCIWRVKEKSDGSHIHLGDSFFYRLFFHKTLLSSFSSPLSLFIPNFSNVFFRWLPLLWLVPILQNFSTPVKLSVSLYHLKFLLDSSYCYLQRWIKKINYEYITSRPLKYFRKLVYMYGSAFTSLRKAKHFRIQWYVSRLFFFCFLRWDADLTPD